VESTCATFRANAEAAAIYLPNSGTGVMDFELRLLWAALIGYVLAGSLSIIAVVFRKKPERAILGLLTAALALHALSLGLRWDRLGHGPFVSMFEILSSNVFSLLTVFAIAYWRVRPIRPVAAVVMPVMFIMMGWMLMQPPEQQPLPSTYHTIWLYIHIGFGKVFLGAVLIAVGISAVILGRRTARGSSWFANLPGDEPLSELSFRFMALGLVFDSLMLIAGAIWAQDAWGRYWAWDPLETWAFITWLIMVLSIHARLAYRIAPRAGAVLIITAFVVAFLTLFGVPFVSAVPHKGAV
jgi:ABC-type transport system involved in cytochrome c biogenesis permease subunit